MLLMAGFEVGDDCIDTEKMQHLASWIRHLRCYSTGCIPHKG
jgi:hypothetical protein